jgi:hypothetical protein
VRSSKCRKEIIHTSRITWSPLPNGWKHVVLYTSRKVKQYRRIKMHSLQPKSRPTRHVYVAEIHCSASEQLMRRQRYKPSNSIASRKPRRLVYSHFLLIHHSCSDRQDHARIAAPSTSLTAIMNEIYSRTQEERGLGQGLNDRGSPLTSQEASTISSSRTKYGEYLLIYSL